MSTFTFRKMIFKKIWQLENFDQVGGRMDWWEEDPEQEITIQIMRTITIKQISTGKKQQIIACRGWPSQKFDCFMCLGNVI